MREQFKLASFVGGLLRASRPPDFARLFFLEVVKERLFTNLADTPKIRTIFCRCPPPHTSLKVYRYGVSFNLEPYLLPGGLVWPGLETEHHIFLSWYYGRDIVLPATENRSFVVYLRTKRLVDEFYQPEEMFDRTWNYHSMHSFSSCSLAKSPPRDLQITAYKSWSAYAY